MGNRQFDDFDRFAAHYRDDHTSNVKQISGVDSDYFSEYKIMEIKKWEKDASDLSVLDFGCGDGNSAAFFKKHLQPRSYCGIDVSSESIDLASKRGLERCSFQCYNGEKIPFDTETFDIIFMANVLHHVDFSLHRHMIDECIRVLKTAGRLYVFEHNPLNPVTRKIVRDCIFDADAKLIPSRYLVRLLREAGLGTTEKRYTIFFPRKSFFKALIPMEKHLNRCPLGGQYFIRCVK
ncbi:MAG: class I SAM-dependent methyltransferase [Oscillospiraceae bacterium]|nr:class I SAM-dependent methyltransferase [Oscillospiraceae bacterium]